MPTKRPPAYPFVPRSNAYLEPGQFFAIPLNDGRFAAGQVLTIPTPETAPNSACNTRAVVLGLLDWVGDRPPTAGDVTRRKILLG